MKRTETAKRYGRRALMNEERNAALPAVPAASTNGSTGRQQVAAARTLPMADSAAASAPFEGDFPAVLIVSVFMDARSSPQRANRIIGESRLLPAAECAAWEHQSPQQPPHRLLSPASSYSRVFRARPARSHQRRY